MAKPKKINESNKEQIAADMKAMSRSDVCTKWGVDYAMLRREFGNAWKHGPGVVIKEEASVGNP